MIYIFDSSTLIDLFRHYYPSRFPTLWQRFAISVESQTVLSVREVLNEVVDFKGSDRLSGWVKVNRQCFQTATAEELQFVAQIFAVPHFRSMVRTQERLQGKPVADPFVIAKAKVLAGCVVTEENYKPNSSKIPNVCEHFGIECLDLEGFMERENWLF